MELDHGLIFVETHHSDPDIACCQVPNEIETGLTKTTLWETMITYDNYGKPAIVQNRAAINGHFQEQTG